MLSASALYATPSTQIWNPSTDIQELHKWHLGIDDYFSIVNNDTKPNQTSTDVNLTYGLVKNLEVGIDMFEPRQDPAQFNIKYGLPEGDKMPAVAVGIENVGLRSDNSIASRPANNYDIAYAILAKTFKVGTVSLPRLSVGYYEGNGNLLVDENGNKANTGMILSLDKQINDKWWASIDYASGQSWYGETSVGFSYAFAPNTSVIFGYVMYNNSSPNLTTQVINTTNNQFTTQLDINF
jgi:hypothetical protein